MGRLIDNLSAVLRSGAVGRRLKQCVLCMAIALAITTMLRQVFSQHLVRVHAQTANNRYVEPSVCAQCHAQIAASYRSTGMGESFRAIAHDSMTHDGIGKIALYNKASDRHYTVVWQQGSLQQQRYQADFDGKATNQTSMTADYVIGSGRHGRTYLHRTTEGKLLELPVSWYSDLGGEWAMSPGYDSATQQDFRRAITYECMFCHNAYPAAGDISTSKSDRESFGINLPEGIDCQRCHGPGEPHVRAASHGAPVAEIRNAILNPSRLNRQRQMDICMQCHLETTSTALPHAIRNVHREIFSYRPGEALQDYELAFDYAPGTSFDNRFQVAQQAYQLRKSVCYRKSEMTCTTCHNPHVEMKGEEAEKHYVQVCKGCHANAHASVTQTAQRNSNCLSCHMWKRRTDDAVQVVMTDHFIQRIKPPNNFLAIKQEQAAIYRGEVIPYDFDSFTQVRDHALYRDVAQTDDDSNLEAGIPRLKTAIEQEKPENAAFYFILGAAYSKTGRFNEAIPWYEESLRRDATYLPAARALLETLVSTNQLDKAARVGENALTIAPKNTALLTDLGSIYLRMGRTNAAKKVLLQALAIAPNLPQANLFLGSVWKLEGNNTAAESAWRDAINARPEMPDAHSDLAMLLAGEAKYEEAAFHFRKAIAGDPTSSQTRRNYAVLLANRGDISDAVKEMRTAVALSPKSSAIHADLAEILRRAGNASEAESELRKSLELNSK